MSSQLPLSPPCRPADRRGGPRQASRRGLASPIAAWILLAAAPVLSPALHAASVAYVANSDDGTVSVIDESNTVVATIPVGPGPGAVALNPAGTRAYVARGSAVSVIDTRTNTVVNNIGGLPSGAFGLAITADGTRIYVATCTSRVAVLDAVNETFLRTITTGAAGSCNVHLAITPDGSKVYVSDINADAVRVIHTADDTVTTIPSLLKPVGIAVEPNGNRVFVCSFYGDVFVINTASDTVAPTSIDAGPVAFGVAFHPTLPRAYVASDGVTVIDTALNTVVTSVPFAGGPNGVGVSVDGSKVYVASYENANVGIIDTATDTLIGAPVPVGGTPYGFEKFVGVDNWFLSDGFESGDTSHWIT